MVTVSGKKLVRNRKWILILELLIISEAYGILLDQTSKGGSSTTKLSLLDNLYLSSSIITTVSTPLLTTYR